MSSPPTESTRLLRNSQANGPREDAGPGNSSRRNSHRRSRASSYSSAHSVDARLRPTIYDGLNQHLGYNVMAPPTYFGTNTPDMGLKSPSGPIQGEVHFESPGVDISSGYTLHQMANECYVILRMALPLVFSYILQNSIPLGSVYSLGHIGPTELAASALSNMFATVTGWSVAMGMATALDTLCSQAYTGASDPHAVGVHLQRGILISLTLLIPVGVLWWTAESILLLLKLDSKLAAFCGRYLRILLFGAPPYVVFECLKKFLQAQEIMTAPTYILISVVPINVALNFFLVWYPKTTLGFDGAPLSVVLTNWIMMTICILYICFVRGSSGWGGWTKRSLTGWWPFLKLGVPGIVMICAEWWAFEIMGLAASYLGELQLAAHAVNITTCNLFYMVPLGLSIASSNRMGHLLGDKTPNRARLCAYCSLILALIFASLNSTVLIVFRDFWAYLFTSDADVAKLARTLLPICALFQVFDGMSGISGGLLRGQGRQKLGAIVNVVCYYGISIPIGLSLAFLAKWGVHGLWWGLSFALFLSASTLTTAVLKTDWIREIEACQERLDAEEASQSLYEA